MDLAWAICFVQGTCWIEDDSSLGGKQVLQGGDTVWELSVILWDIILCQFESIYIYIIYIHTHVGWTYLCTI